MDAGQTPHLVATFGGRVQGASPQRQPPWCIRPPTGSTYPPVQTETYGACWSGGGRLKFTAPPTALAGAVAMWVSR